MSTGEWDEKDDVLETAELLKDEIDTVDDFDMLEDELRVDDEIIAAEQRENDQLRAQLAAKSVGPDMTATEVMQREGKVEIKRDWLGRRKVDETNYKEHLDVPVQENVFTVHGKSFHSFNEALQYEVLQDLKNKTFCMDRFGFEDHAVDAEDERPNSVECMGEFCIPLDLLAENIDEIALILREYEKKKQR